MDRTSRQKMNKRKQHLNNTVNHMDLTFHPTAADYAVHSAEQVTCWIKNQVLPNFGKLKAILGIFFGISMV
jgi:hypothetical protein